MFHAVGKPSAMKCVRVILNGTWTYPEAEKSCPRGSQLTSPSSEQEHEFVVAKINKSTWFLDKYLIWTSAEYDSKKSTFVDRFTGGSVDVVTSPAIDRTAVFSSKYGSHYAILLLGLLPTTATRRGSALCASKGNGELFTDLFQTGFLLTNFCSQQVENLTITTFVILLDLNQAVRNHLADESQTR